MNKNKFYTKLTSGIFYLSILLFIIAFNFSDNGSGGWTQQFLPSNLPGITDITFTDSLTGYAVTGVDSDNKSYIIKTSNSGDKWNVILQDSGGRAFTKVNFINSVTGFACTKWNSGSAKLYKTINGGDNWSLLNNPPLEPSYLDLSVVSENELWIVDNIAFDGGVYRTTNGGQTWERKYYDISRPADRVYMINSRIGFISDGHGTNNFLRKTIDSGNSWNLISGAGGWKDIFFKDSLSGWRSLISINNVRSTTDGGINWSTILIAQSGNPSKEINQFSIINDDTIWGIGSYIYFPNMESRGIILKTTTGGKNWGYQLPDTSIRINGSYSFLNFINKNIGWSYANSTTGVHTIKGGDTITYIYTGIQSLNNNVSSDFELFQNYPNPFNPTTKIKYQLNKSGFVNIKVFNILGKEIEVLINARQSAGEYGVSFDASNYPGGVYFYSLYVDNKIINTRKMILIK